MEKYNLKQSFADRQLLIVIYREYQIRLKLCQKACESYNDSEWEKWGTKTNHMIAVFNRLAPFVETANPIPYLEAFPVKEDIRAVLRYVREEVNNRAYFYPIWLKNKRIKYNEARAQLDGMKAVCNRVIELKHEIEGVQAALF